MLSQTPKRFWIWPAVIVAGLLLLLWGLPQLLPVCAKYQLTDILIFCLVAGVIFLTAYIRHKPHLLEPWRRVLQSHRAMAAAVVLVVYVVIGLLDSIHFQEPLEGQPESVGHYSVDVPSLFDFMTRSLQEQTEKTYSAPLATHLFVKESVVLEDGTTAQQHRRLEHGGAHLADPQTDKWPDIAYTALQGLVWGLLLWSLLALLVSVWHARTAGLSPGASWRAIWRGRSRYPLNTLLVTAGILLVMLAILFTLSQKYHVFGTDKVGQDVFYLSLKSIRTGLVIGTLTTLVMLPFAILLGIMAGYFRGWIDDLIQYLYTTLNSIPGVLLIAAAILSIQVYIANHPELFDSAMDRADLRLLALCVVLGITSWTNLCRLLRGESLKLRELEYVEAARAFGVHHFTILGRHILPNVLHIVLIVVVLEFSGLVLAEAVLSYVGVGVDPSTISWGNMINGARLELAREPVVWWSLVAAFILMFALVLAANLFADAVRDAFDPRLGRIPRN
ncbi:ABC transporter permease [Thiohalophilus thiocyanatoxydans]|uniref:Peptide/nickel transport system permease protein n=1 Tax=Thiohalophilus thiocyanatoxydans TaxID=381308 RepID=A0A4R8IHJ4_9GAMM|nr:ABC transporter permease [Thiohalophilus thiocyanatoxydans]TDY00081.1 peptide/nickel transport system permease protein [Thiohalophilus thiocyanatoxydans]